MPIPFEKKKGDVASSKIFTVLKSSSEITPESDSMPISATSTEVTPNSTPSLGDSSKTLYNEEKLKKRNKKIQLAKNLTMQCKAINPDGILVYDGIFGADIYCEYMDKSGMQRFDMLSKGSKVKYAMHVGILAVSIVFLKGLIIKLLHLPFNEFPTEKVKSDDIGLNVVTKSEYGDKILSIEKQINAFKAATSIVHNLKKKDEINAREFIDSGNYIIGLADGLEKNSMCATVLQNTANELYKLASLCSEVASK